MSFEEELEKAAAEVAREKMGEWRKNPKWLAIDGITKDDLKNGTGIIEKLDRPPWDKKANSQENKSNEELVGFGKYAAKEVKWVKENDFRYFTWMLENVPKFAAKVKLLKL